MLPAAICQVEMFRPDLASLEAQSSLFGNAVLWTDDCKGPFSKHSLVMVRQQGRAGKRPHLVLRGRVVSDGAFLLSFYVDALLDITVNRSQTSMNK